MKPRAFTRVLVHIDASLRTDSGQEVRGVVRDLSLQGVSIQGDGTANPGDDCTITIFLATGAAPIPIRLAGTVVRHDDGVVAATFSSVAAEDVDHLERLVHYNAPDPAILDAELVAYPFKRPAAGAS